MKKNCNDKFEKLIKLFKNWNSKINLSAIRDDEGIKIKHIKDSLTILSDDFLVNFPYLKKFFDKKLKVADVGTGGGFPLVPLAICKKNWNLIWIESKNKKVKAVNDIISKLWLKNVEVIWFRAEDVKQNFDIVTARAVAYITKLLPWVSHLVKRWWFLILYKQNSEEEFEDLKKEIWKFGFKLEWYYDYKLFPDDIIRRIYILRKL